LRGYIATTNVSNKDIIKTKIEQLHQTVKSNAPLRELLARPVHLPMLVNVLPTWDGTAESLNRPILYKRFIQNIITREMSRLSPAFRQKY